MKDKQREMKLKTIVRGEYAQKFVTVANAKEMSKSEFLRECVRYTLENRYGFKPPITR